MVIPFVKEDQDIRTVLEADPNKRIAITRVKEGFDTRGFSTIDFRAKLKQTQTDKAFEIENQTTLKQQLIELSGADFYVETDVNVNYNSTGNSVTVILNGYDAFSGQSLANKVSTSPKFYTNDIAKLTDKAVNACIDDFLNVMNQKFSGIIANGRTLSLSITFTTTSKWNMDSEIGSDHALLSDVVETWLEKNAYKKYYHIQGITASKMIIDDVRVPLKEEFTNNNYRPSRFLANFRTYLKSLGIETTRDILGSKLFVTIQ
ncbi:DUF6175 family protein [Cytophagaceae bacterium DM2B3-1]|uniref:DUF6175 family protein n=1 Tax=Xanthocytophaga flava TaxID=3048013 RepID=A0ABT7CSH9_9BACT|nr:DUF6175 family protein [Xanthocytophaga flavus]MDJ1496688.1 DUF6175 family protein [Xanthocytophaga flavus]